MPVAAPTSAAVTLALSDFGRRAPLPANFPFQNPLSEQTPSDSNAKHGGKKREHVNTEIPSPTAQETRNTAQLYVRKVLRGTLQWGEARDGTSGPRQQMTGGD